MKIRVNHGELEKVKEKMNEDTNELQKEIDDILKKIEELKNVWQGEEANIFYIKYINYLNYLKTVPQTYTKLTAFMGKANISYKNADLNLKKEINDVRMNS